ncbi:MAG: hypothetical protein IT305_06405 [Chloroflexi bacterium]|nr:hypothetical protein [Chloroflexota bacterium]
MRAVHQCQAPRGEIGLAARPATPEGYGIDADELDAAPGFGLLQFRVIH